MNKISKRDDISGFFPFVKSFIIISLLFSVFILFVTIKVVAKTEISLQIIVLTASIFTFIIMILGFCYIVNKEFMFIKKYIRRLNKSKNADDIDIEYNIKNKFRFIKDAEMLINSKLEDKYALVHYDLSKFTIVNNIVGYKVGDEIIQLIGKTLRKNLKDEIIGKADGDNFFVLFEYKSIEELIERTCFVSDKIESMSIWSKVSINPVIKTGICLIDNVELDIRTAIDRANFAKQSLDDSYKSGYAIYDNKIGISLIETKRIENEMHKALEGNEFKVYLQPKVDLKTGEISGAEALVRWEHPELGLLSPDKFISIFEKNGFIVKLDMYVFEQVCINLRKWIDLGYDVVPVSVNLSRVHFLNSNFISDYHKIKKKYLICDNLIEIEITESVVFSNENENEVFKVMRKIRDVGFEISMDDFGSGYSCLGLLKEMPIDTLKLDRMFLKNIEEYKSQIIVSNIVDMAKHLNLNVISEGVETEKQVDFLRDIGCDMAQGFVFAKPEPVETYEKLINKGKINYYQAVI
ncbi:MAG: putative signaling protein [Sedimentibacter sp.]|nr:putative signaling protein [Sedimentibacter sp.]